MVKQKSKFKGLFKGAAIGFAFIMCSAFFPVHAIASALEGVVTGDNIKVNSIKVDGSSTNVTVQKGETVSIPAGEYVDADGNKRTVEDVKVFYKATNDEVNLNSDGKSFTADRVGRYTITYSVEDNGMTYTYDLTVKCEVSDVSFDFSSNSKNIIPSYYDKQLAGDKDIVLPLPSVKDAEGENVIGEDEVDYFTNVEPNSFQVGDKTSFVYISLANDGDIRVLDRTVDGKTEYYLDHTKLAALSNNQEVKVLYSYYQVSESNKKVFVTSTSKTFTVKDKYFYKSSDKKEENKGYDLETSWSTSVSDLTAIVGVERELPKITATTKSTNSPANEAVEVYYTIKVEKRGTNGKYDGTDISSSVINKDGKFVADDEGTYKFTYTVTDFYGNEAQTSRTSFEIANVKDSRSANVFVYDAGNPGYNADEKTYTSALDMLKSQTGNRNVVVYAVGGTDNFKDKEDLTLRRTILDNTGVTMFDVREKAYHEYNLIFMPNTATGAGEGASVYKQIVDDNYHIRKQMVLAGTTDFSDANIIKFLNANKYLLVTTKFNKTYDDKDIVANLTESDEEKVAKMMASDDSKVGYAYVKPSRQSDENRKTFTDGTYTVIYGASDNINSEKTSRYSMGVTADFTDSAVPTLTFPTDLQVAYLATDKITFDVATATDSTSQDSRLETVTAYRFLRADRETAVESTQTPSTLRYYINKANSDKWFAETGVKKESAGWYFDTTKTSYTINLAEKPADAKYVEILAYAIDDYGNAGFYNKIIRIADVQDELMPTLYKASDLPGATETFEAPMEINLPTLYFSDDNAGYMHAQVNVYKLVKDSDGKVTGKVPMQAYNMKTEFNSVQKSYMVNGGYFRASTSGQYQVAITVSDAGNHNYTTYFNYNVGGGIVFDEPEIDNITSETIELKAGEAYYLVPPTLSISENDEYGFIGISEDDDSNTATYYTPTIISSTDGYELDQYYFTGSKKGVYKLIYKVYLMQYSKDAAVFAKSEADATDGQIFLTEGTIGYKHAGEIYYVYIDMDEDGDHVLAANTSLQGIGTALTDESALAVLNDIVKVYYRESKTQTINVGGVDMNVTLDDDLYAKSYDKVGTTIPIVKPNNIEYNGSGYETNNEASTVVITKTTGNTTTTLADLNFKDWGSKLTSDNSDFTVDSETGEITLTLKDNGRYVIKYSIQAMDKNGTNVGTPKVVEYTIKNGDVVGPEVELSSQVKIVEDTYRIGDTIQLNLAGLTVSDNQTDYTAEGSEDIDYATLAKDYMTVRLRNTTQSDESYTTLVPDEEALANGEVVYTHKIESAGSYTLTIIVKDKAGNESTVTKSFEVTTDQKKDVDVKEVMGGVLIALSVAILAGVVIYFVVSKVKLDKKENKYKNK